MIDRCSEPFVAGSTDLAPKVKMEAVNGSRKREERTVLPGLGSDMFQSFLGYLEHSDRLALAETCKSAVAAVEAYSFSALEKHIKDHVVDDSFETRVKDSFLEKTTASGKTAPSRCLLHAARRTYLCTLEILEDNINGYETDCIYCETDISKDGEHVLWPR